MNQHFDKYSGAYDDLVASSTGSLSKDGRFHRAKLECLLDRVPTAATAQRLLDFGCGIGGMTSFVADFFPSANIVGFDPSPKSIATAQTTFPPSCKVEFCNAFPEDDRFDLILAANVFHHIAPAAREAELQRLLGVLAPGGRLIVFEHNPYNPLTRYVVSQCQFDEDAVLVSRSKFARLAFSCGFQVEAQAYFLFLPIRTRWTRKLDAALKGLPLGAQYMLSMVTR